jgi:RNA polymerase sigma factor (sigma-70 family)
MNSSTDNQLMVEVKNGKVEKLAILFERQHVALYNFFLRLTGNRSISEDLVQDVFMRILKYRYTYLGQSKFTVWMYQIARNAHVDYLRKKKPEIPLEEQWNVPISKDIAPSKQLERRQEIALLHKALAKLPVKKREMLVLSRFQHLKYTEIAELFGCHTGTIKAYIHRAIKDLRKIYFELSGGIAS